MIEAAVLHPEILYRVPRGDEIWQYLKTAATLSAAQVDQQQIKPCPDISLVIRTHRDRDSLPALFQDIGSQAYRGNLQIIVADGESDDGTAKRAEELGRELARTRSVGVEVVSITQSDFNYPRGLNTALSRVVHPHAVCTTGHSLFSTDRTFDAVARWASDVRFGGAFGPALPGANASRWEQWGATRLGVVEMLKNIVEIEQSGLGVMASDRVAINMERLRELDGYNEAYGAGGEDNDLARKMLAAKLKIMLEPVMAMHHTHGLDAIGSATQLLVWEVTSRWPLPFNERLHRFLRPDQHRTAANEAVAE